MKSLKRLLGQGFDEFEIFHSLLVSFLQFKLFFLSKRLCVSFVFLFCLFGIHLFFDTKPVYKQLALEWQITKQISGLNSFSTSQQ